MKRTPKSFLWKGKIYSDLSKAPSELLDSLRERGWYGNKATAESTEQPTFDATDGAVTFAKENNIDLATITGTGANGRIVKSDVENAAKAAG